jgi:hypothetical protein
MRIILQGFKDLNPGNLISKAPTINVSIPDVCARFRCTAWSSQVAAPIQRTCWAVGITHDTQKNLLFGSGQFPDALLRLLAFQRHGSRVFRSWAQSLLKGRLPASVWHASAVTDFLDPAIFHQSLVGESVTSAVSCRNWAEIFNWVSLATAPAGMRL